MSYNNNYQSRSGQNRNYNSGQNRSFNGGGQRQQAKKHSGAVGGKDKNDNPYVRGWKYDRRNGLRSFFACPYGKTKNVTSASGKVWENWMCKVTFSDGRSEIFGAMYDVQARKVIIKDLGFVMNPKGGKGGYTGSFVNN